MLSLSFSEGLWLLHICSLLNLCMSIVVVLAAYCIRWSLNCFSSPIQSFTFDFSLPHSPNKKLTISSQTLSWPFLVLWFQHRGAILIPRLADFNRRLERQQLVFHFQNDKMIWEGKLCRDIWRVDNTFFQSVVASRMLKNRMKE